jgi:hypothetical protein
VGAAPTGASRARAASRLYKDRLRRLAFRDDALIAATLADEASREDVVAFAVAHRVDANQVPVSRMHIAGVMPVAPDRRR